jgi:hypothetical protein
MISNRPDVSAHQGTPPAEGDDRTIPGGPLYALGEVQALARSERLAFWSAGAMPARTGEMLLLVSNHPEGA